MVVPGSGKPIPVMSDQVLVDWLRTAAPNCKWTASVCTGAGLYAAAGLLEGKTTTTHWAFRDNLRAMGVEVVADRVVWQGNHVSGAGVSTGIRHGTVADRPRPRTQARGITATGDQVRPTATVCLRLADQSRCQHAAPCVPAPRRRPAGPIRQPGHRTGQRRSTPARAHCAIRPTPGAALGMTSHPLTLPDSFAVGSRAETWA